MTIDNQIKDEKLQYDLNRQAAKISALSTSKIDEYKYLTGEEMLLSNEKQIIEQAKCAYSPLGKAFGKQTKLIEDQIQKQIKATEDNRKQLANTNVNDYKNELLVSKKEKYLRIFVIKSLIK